MRRCDGPGPMRQGRTRLGGFSFFARYIKQLFDCERRETSGDSQMDVRAKLEPGRMIGRDISKGEAVEHEKSPAAVTKGAVERHIIGWTHLFESLSTQQQWNRREDEGEGVGAIE
jgi:hypothetical protein